MSKNIKEIGDILNLIYSGQYSNNDIAMLFVYLRDIDKSKGLIRELGDFIAHPTRNCGPSHELISGYIKKIIEVSANGGTINSKRLASKDTIITGIIKLLAPLLNSFDEKQFRSRCEDIMGNLYKKLDGIEFTDIDPKVRKCFLKNQKNKVIFCFNLSLTQGRIQMGPEALWCNTLFD